MKSPASRTVGAGIALLALLVAGCAGPMDQRRELVIPIAGRAAERVPAPEPEPEPEQRPNKEPLILRGDDQLFKPPRPLPDGVGAGDPVSLDFEQAPVTEVIHAVLGDILQLPYVINQPVDGSLTIHTVQPLPREQLLPVFEALLQANGLALVVGEGGVYHVGKPETLRGIAPNLGNLGGALPPGQNLVIVPLRFIGAQAAADILAPIADPNAILRVDGLRNLLILAGSRSQIDGYLDIVRTFDIDVLDGMSIGLFPLEHVNVAEVAAALSALSGEGEGAAPGKPPAGRVAAGGGEQKPGTAPDQGPGAAGLGLPGPLAGVVKVIALERLNALLVVTSRAHYLDRARDWIERFDQPRGDGNEPQLFVYEVQNGTSEHLAELLNALYGGSSTTLSGGADSGVAPGLGGSRLGGGAFGDGRTGMGSGRGGTFGSGGGGFGSNRGAFGSSRSGFTSSNIGGTSGILGGSGGLAGGGLAGGGLRGGQSGMPQTAVVEFGPDVRVVSDEFNNALLVYAPRRDYEKIRDALRRLDVPPTQILIEASILEVTLTDELSYGLQWAFNNGLGSNGRTGTGLFNPNSSGGIGPQQPGFSYTITNRAGEVRAVLNALAQKNLVNVISSPSIMVLDNHNAQIQVGNQQPVQSSTIVTDGGNTTSSIEFKDTGVMLNVLPSVNAGGLVTMDVSQAVTDVGPVDEATGQRSFLQREILSRVSVRSGETVVLGGLIRDNTSQGNLGVPFLKDIPLLGNLFRTQSRTNDRTELVVLITPQSLQNDAQLRAVSDEMRRRFSNSLGGIVNWSEIRAEKPAQPGESATPAQPEAGKSAEPAESATPAQPEAE
jgi:general secretion pathway protein D